MAKKIKKPEPLKAKFIREFLNKQGDLSMYLFCSNGIWSSPEDYNKYYDKYFKPLRNRLTKEYKKLTE